MPITYLDSEPQAPASGGGGITYLEPETERPKEPKQGRDLRDELVRQLGRFGRMAATGPTAVGGALADFGYGATGVVSNLAGKPNPLGNVRPSDAYQKALTEKVGLPEDQGFMENLTQFVGQAAAGGFDPAMAGIQNAVSKMVPQGFQGSQATAKALTAKELHDAGIKLEPTAVEGGSISRTAQGFGGTANTARQLQNANQPRLQELAAREVGVDPRHITEDSLKEAAQAWIKQGYDPIKELPKIRTGKLYREALDDIAAKYHPKSFPTKTQPQLVEDLNDLRVGGFEPSEALTKIQQLRDKASTQFGPGGDPTYGKALREMSKALEDQIERNLTNPQLLVNFKEARTALAKNYALREMLVDKSTGTISTPKAQALLERGEPLTGGLLTIAKAGSPDFVRSTAPNVQGKGVPFNWGDTSMYGGSLLAAPFTGGASLGLAGVPPLRAAARKGLMSDTVQKALIDNMQGAPSMFGAPAQRVMTGSMPNIADIMEQLFPTSNAQ